MNPFSKKLSLVLLSAAIVFAGCTKKPKRPSPGDTMLGREVGESALNPQDTNLSPVTEDPNSLLKDRPPGYMEDENTIRGLLQPVYFDLDSPIIKAGERVKLQEAHRYLTEHPEYRLRLEGHCDWRGTGEYNLGLGDRRGGAAKQYLSTLGVAATKLEVQSKGDLDAIENASEDQMSKDRRVELVILKK